WSSDVCSSDLGNPPPARHHDRARDEAGAVDCALSSVLSRRSAAGDRRAGDGPASPLGGIATVMEPGVVELSRLQFALTALYHFLFVPLTLGLSLLLAVMESVYVMTERRIWRAMTRFWGTLFGINFAMGVATGITMEFQFGTNWAYYSHYVGDIFGAPLALEGLMAFFLEATFVGIFFFGWDRLSRVGHLIVT